jgi:hypothetical protein
VRKLGAFVALVVAIGAIAFLAIAASYLWPAVFSQDPVVRTSATTAVATLALAGVGLLSVLTGIASVVAAERTLDVTTKLATTAEQEASAARAQAEAAVASLEEIRRDRELEFRPHLKVTGDWTPRSDGFEVHMEVKNIGRGPALDCTLCVHAMAEQDTWASWWNFFDLGPGDSIEVPDLTTSSGDDGFRGIAEDLDIGPNTYVVVVAYHDVLGSSMRAVHGFGYHRTDAARDDSSPAAWTIAYDAIRKIAAATSPLR